jgi:hypothetical protein
VIDEGMGEEIRITVIATGFGAAVAAQRAAPPARPAAAPAVAGSRPVFAAASQGVAAQSIGAQSIRRVGASDRPVRRLGVLVDDGGEPKFKPHEDDPAVPDRPQTEFTIAEEDEAADYESPAFLRYQAK